MTGKKTKKSLQNFTLRTIPIAQIKRAKYNPRRGFTETELKSFEADMEHFSCVLPLVWNEHTGNLIGGHKRLDWLEKKGTKTVQVAVVNLDEKEEKLLNLALNRQGEGLWNEEKLEIVLSELSVEGLDLELAGFSDFGAIMSPESEWGGMPEYVQEDQGGYQIIQIHFKTEKDVKSFAELIKQKITPKTRALWYPEAKHKEFIDKRYISES